MSFKTMVLVKGENPEGSTNALRFETRQEADAYGDELLSRWTVPYGHRVDESSDAVNYRFDFDAYKAKRIAS